MSTALLPTPRHFIVTSS